MKQKIIVGLIIIAVVIIGMMFLSSSANAASSQSANALTPPPGPTGPTQPKPVKSAGQIAHSFYSGVTGASSIVGRAIFDKTNAVGDYGMNAADSIAKKGSQAIFGDKLGGYISDTATAPGDLVWGASKWGGNKIADYADDVADWIGGLF